MKKLYNKHKETINNFFWRWLNILWKQWAMLFIFFLSSKLLSLYDFWIYNYIFSILTIIIIFADFWISKATSKYVTEYKINKEKELWILIFNSLFLIILIVFILIPIFYLIWKIFFNDYLIYFPYLSILIFLLSSNSLLEWVFLWLKKFKKLSIINLVSWIISIFISYFLILHYGIIWTILSQILFNSLLFIWFLIFLPLRIEKKINKKVLIHVMKYGYIIWIWWIALYLYTTIDNIFLWYFWYMKEISYIELINKILWLWYIIINIFATIRAPYNIEMYTKNKKKVLNKIKSEIRYIFLWWLILTIIIYLFWAWFISVYDIPKVLFILLLIIFPLKFVSSYITEAYILPLGYAKISVKYLLIVGILNIILDYILIKIYWYIGVVYATIACSVLYIFLKDFTIYKIFKDFNK